MIPVLLELRTWYILNTAVSFRGLRTYTFKFRSRLKILAYGHISNIAVVPQSIRIMIKLMHQLIDMVVPSLCKSIVGQLHANY